MYDDYKLLAKESDECLSKGICSVSPTLSSLNEIILLYLKGISFYLLELKDLGITYEECKDTIMYTIFNIISNIEYNQEQFHDIIVKLYDYILLLKTLYEKTCQERNLEIKSLKIYFKYSKKFDLMDAIRKGEKYYLKKVQSFSPRQKDLYDILIFLAKSISIKIIELQKFDKTYDEAYYALLSLLNAASPGGFSEEKVKQLIKDSIDVYYNVAKRVFYTHQELYGEMTPTEVSFSTEPGKAILVSGTDLKQLESVLRAVENTGVGVYTHGIEMLMAHIFPKLRSHPNLKGHFGSGLESSLIDFASFPGAILMTKAVLQRIDYLYRGKLFSLDPITPLGVSRIKDNNFGPLIQSALDAKGFINAQRKPPLKVGFDEKEIIKKITDIINKIRSGEIRHLFIIGLLNFPVPEKEYFQKLFEIIPEDCFIISLCCQINAKENVFHLDSFYYYGLVYRILKKIREEIPLNEIDISIFLTKCDKYTIANLLYLKHINIKNVYTCKCPPILVSPSVINTLHEIYGIKEISEPQKDLDEILAK